MSVVHDMDGPGDEFSSHHFRVSPYTYSCIHGPGGRRAVTGAELYSELAGVVGGGGRRRGNGIPFLCSFRSKQKGSRKA